MKVNVIEIETILNEHNREVQSLITKKQMGLSEKSKGESRARIEECMSELMDLFN